MALSPSKTGLRSAFGIRAREARAKRQEDRLRAWVAANFAALIADWNGDILYDEDLRSRLVPLGAARS